MRGTFRLVLLAGLAAATLAFAAAPARAQDIPPELEERYNAARADFDRAEPACELAAMQDALNRVIALDAEIEQIANLARSVPSRPEGFQAVAALKLRVSGEVSRQRILLERCRREGPRRTPAPDPAPVTSPGTGQRPETAPVPSPGTGQPPTTAPVPSPSTAEPPEGIGPRTRARFDAALEDFREASGRCDVPRMRAAYARMQAAYEQLSRFLDGLYRAGVQNRDTAERLGTQAMVMSFATRDALAAIERCEQTGQARPGEPGAPGPFATETERAQLLRAALDADRRFQLARDRCDPAGMAAALSELEGYAAAAAQRGDENAGSIRTLRDNARAEREARCPAPPPPAIETPVNPQPATDDVMQAPRRDEGATFNVGFGGTWLSDGDLDLGLAGATLDVDLPLSQAEESGLGQVRLGPRFRLTGDLQTGLIDQSNESGAFRDSLGLQWSATGLAGIALPLGDRDPADPGEGFTLFGQAGYGFARFEFEASGPGFDFEDSSTSDFFAFRLGGEYAFDGRNAVRVTYTRWDDFQSDGISANLFGISYVRVLGQRP